MLIALGAIWTISRKRCERFRSTPGNWEVIPERVFDPAPAEV
jgi:hypothetical protein